MISLDDIRTYHCPRWDELPDLELYMDQVTSVLDKNLRLFAKGDERKGITPTMINNYVKQKMVSPPKNKRYNKGHLAAFFIITLLKQIMSIAEIHSAIQCVTRVYPPEDGYDRFCDILENSLKVVFFEQQEYELAASETNSADGIIRSITLAYSNMLYAGYLMSVEKSGEDR